MNIPALNQINRQTMGEEPKYPENHEELRYLILYPDDYEGYGSDIEGNVALLLNEQNAREVKKLAEEIIEMLE
jgi:hypothetical protein